MRNARITITLDGSEAVRTARHIDREVEGIGGAAERAMRKLDREFDQGFRRAMHSARSFAGGAMQSFFGNITATAFAAATNATRDFLAGSIDQAVKATDATRFLASASRQAALNFSDMKREAAALGKELNVSAQQAERLLAQATMRSMGTGIDPVEFLRQFANAAAAAGESVKSVEIASLFTDDALLNRLGLQDPGAIKQQWARARGLNPDLMPQDLQNRAIIEAVVEQGRRNPGAAASRGQDIGGQLDSLSSSFENLQASVGSLLARNEGLRELFGMLGKGIEDLLAGTQNAGTSFKEFRQTAGEVGATVGWLAAKIGETYESAGLIADYFIGAVMTIPKALQVMAADVTRALVWMSTRVADAVRLLLGDGATLLGIPSADTTAREFAAAQKDLDDAKFEMAAFSQAQDRNIEARVARIDMWTKRASEWAKAGEKVAETIAEKATTFAPEKQPAATAPAGPQLVYDEATNTFRSIDPSDPGLSVNAQGVATSGAGGVSLTIDPSTGYVKAAGAAGAPALGMAPATGGAGNVSAGRGRGSTIPDPNASPEAFDKWADKQGWLYVRNGRTYKTFEEMEADQVMGYAPPSMGYLAPSMTQLYSASGLGGGNSERHRQVEAWEMLNERVAELTKKLDEQIKAMDGLEVAVQVEAAPNTSIQGFTPLGGLP